MIGFGIPTSKTRLYNVVGKVRESVKGAYGKPHEKRFRDSKRLLGGVGKVCPSRILFAPEDDVVPSRQQHLKQQGNSQERVVFQKQ